MHLKILTSSVFILLTFLLTAQPVDSATRIARQKQYNYYWDKRTSNVTTGWVLLGVGAAATAGGAALIVNDISNDYVGDATGELLLFGAGIGAMITSIPFFISAGSNKRKARLALQTNRVSFGEKATQKLYYATASLTISL